ncbi:hypothetical protein [Streptomyces sp. NPDC005805]|uniref:hypothetical protein n=1 Tax=Streptomyces sp. NPDC005805 TaxID=3157068 RepID=UPI0034080A35
MASIAIAASVVTPGAAFAADGGPDPAPAEVCSGGWRKNVYCYKATHIGKGPVYKDGPGGTMVITRTTAEKVGSSVTGTAGVTVDYAVAQAKAEISKESAREVSWSTDHQYRRNVASGRYGNTQYGSWGHSATWEKYYELPNCRKSQRTSGGVKVVNKAVGFRYWETRS